MEKGNYAKAAESLYLSNSTISKTITKLEKELGFVLFTRNTRGMIATPMAHVLYQSWNSAFKEIQQGYSKAKIECDRDSNVLNLGIPNTSNPQRYLWPKTQDFMAENSNISLNITSRNWNELIYEVKKGTYDIVFLPDFDRYTLDEINLPWHYIAKSAAEAIVIGNSHLEDREELKIYDILNEPLIVYDENVDPNYLRELNNIYDKYGAKPLIGKYSNNIFAGHSYSLSDQLIQIGDHYFQFVDYRDCKRIPITDYENGLIITWKPDMKKTIAYKYIEYMKLD